MNRIARWFRRLFRPEPEPFRTFRVYTPFAHTGSDNCTHCKLPVDPAQNAQFVDGRPVCHSCARVLRGQTGDAQ